MDDSRLKLYGVLLSRARRCMWMLEEMGHPYELVETFAAPEDLRTTAYLRLNPNARTPTLVDGDVVVWESLAINLYLANRYEGPMHVGSPAVLAQATQWSFFAVLELEALARELLDHRINLAERSREASIAERDELLLRRPLQVLDRALDGRAYLLGDEFTVADLNVASILSWAKISKMDFAFVPSVDRWLEACYARPAYLRLAEMIKTDLSR
jgi:glutathione S-transferase